jgi:nitrite reductase/ring-hydroxylating ferredoxin subunit
MLEPDWVDIGSNEDLSARPLRRVVIGDQGLAVSFKEGRFGVVANTCNHACARHRSWLKVQTNW